MLPLHSHPVDVDLASLAAGKLASLPAAPPSYVWPTEVRRPPLGWRLRQAWKLFADGSYFIPAFARLARRVGLVVAYSELRGFVTHADGTATNYGLLGRRVVTTTGVAFLASAFDNTVEPELLKFHGFGTGTTAEAIGDTALVTEFTTEYATDNVRPTGSQAHATNVYTTVGTFAPDSGGTLAVTEHGIFSQAAVAGGTLWDRTKFAAVNLVAGSDSLAATYSLTLPSGG